MDIVTVGITGASGAALAKRVLEHLFALELELHVVATDHGARNFAYETGDSLEWFLSRNTNKNAHVSHHENNDMFASIASGSYGVTCMAVVPCSMSTAGKLAGGCGDSLLTRAADVILKEKARLVLAPRESPLHAVHLRNLLTLSELGAVIMPPVPAFYDGARGLDGIIDGIAGRLLKMMGIPNNLYKKWEGHE